MPLSPSTRSDEVANAIMRNARAAWREQLRNKVIREQGNLPEEELELHVDELVRLARAAAGRKGGAGNRRRLMAVRQFELAYDNLLQTAEDLVRAIRVAGDPQAHCGHTWPAELDEDAYCVHCGLLYSEYSEPVA